MSDACKVLGVKPGILRKWDDEGNIKAIRTPGGMRLKLCHINYNTHLKSIHLIHLIMSNIGKLFEDLIYKELISMNLFDNVYDELYLRKAFGWDSCGCDFLAIKEHDAIAIQLKWRKTRRREDIGIDKFVKSMCHLQKVFHEMDIEIKSGLYISRLEPFKDNIVRMAEYNITSISCFHSMDELLLKTILLLNTIYEGQDSSRIQDSEQGEDSR